MPATAQTTSALSLAFQPIASLSSPTPGRQWSSFPHPSLPIVAVCGIDKAVRIYSLVNFQLLAVIGGGHERSIRSCAWKPKSKELILATGSFDATVGIWKSDINDGDEKLLQSSTEVAGDDEDDRWRFAVLLDGHESEVKSVAWSSNGSMLATCSRDKSIWIWEDLEDGDDNFETVAVLQEHAADVKCLAWHPNEDCLASGSYDDTIRLWREDADDWGQVACLKGHEGTVWSIDWENLDKTRGNQSLIGGDVSEIANDQISSMHPRLVSASDDKTVRIWKRISDKQSPQNTSSIPSIIRPTEADEVWIEETTLPPVHDLSIYSVSWSKHTGHIATTGADGRIAIYEEKQMSGDVDMHNLKEGTSWNSQWEVIRIIEAAHGEYEINHVVWADICEAATSGATQEVLLSTGDDGLVKVWRM
ncbi:WD repeat protein [Ascosphaera apis ARSEF 7405]|uniref:Probable cytosolic iron-sulfur protein assembly protein 1 n=1 Tax=Ascosphaera apis ARSEF 7405 TaxID=392613 RepID=A0A168CZR6_9EURO|nr:WD repeat protein [Ascosphaera apis ARSEF 7405]